MILNTHTHETITLRIYQKLRDFIPIRKSVAFSNILQCFKVGNILCILLRVHYLTFRVGVYLWPIIPHNHIIILLQYWFFY